MKKILVLDADQVVQDTLKSWLSGLGFQVFSADNLEEGVALAASEKPDLILLDALLPGGALECLKKILQKDRSFLVVLLNSVEDEKTAKNAILGGAYDYFSKPIVPAEFSVRVLSSVFPEMFPDEEDAS